MDKNRILHICLCGPVTEGWNYQENMLSKYHKLMGYEVMLIASQYKYDNDGKQVRVSKGIYLTPEGVQINRIAMKYFDGPNRRFQKYYSLYNEIDRFDPSIIFIHSVSFLDISTIVKYLKRHPSVRAYADNHADFGNSASNFLSKRILHGIVWKHYALLISKHVRYIYGVLPAREVFLEKVYNIPREKIRQLLMGADDELVLKSRIPMKKAELRSRYSIGEDDFLIVTGGKYTCDKLEVLMLMKAVDIIGGNCRLLVFGPISEDIRKLFEYTVEKTNTIYEKWVEPQSTYDYFAAADLVVFPSKHSVFWEQVAGQGIPMVARRIQGAMHIDLGGNVEFLDIVGVDELVDTLNGIVRDSCKYNNMKRVAEELGMKVFSYANIAKISIEK